MVPRPPHRPVCAWRLRRFSYDCRDLNGTNPLGESASTPICGDPTTGLSLTRFPALREAVGGKGVERSSSLQRIASAGNLAKSNLGGTASPQMSGDDSPRGFVPFRSLQSYENLLSLQAQGR